MGRHFTLAIGNRVSSRVHRRRSESGRNTYYGGKSYQFVTIFRNPPGIDLGRLRYIFFCLFRGRDQPPWGFLHNLPPSVLRKSVNQTSHVSSMNEWLAPAEAKDPPGLQVFAGPVLLSLQRCEYTRESLFALSIDIKRRCEPCVLFDLLHG